MTAVAGILMLQALPGIALSEPSLRCHRAFHSQSLPCSITVPCMDLSQSRSCAVTELGIAPSQSLPYTFAVPGIALCQHP